MNKNKINYKNPSIYSFITSDNVFSSGLAVYDVDEAVKTSSNNGFSGSDDIL